MRHLTTFKLGIPSADPTAMRDLQGLQALDRIPDLTHTQRSLPVPLPAEPWEVVARIFQTLTHLDEGAALFVVHASTPAVEEWHLMLNPLRLMDSSAWAWALRHLDATPHRGAIGIVVPGLGRAILRPGTPARDQGDGSGAAPLALSHVAREPTNIIEAAEEVLNRTLRWEVHAASQRELQGRRPTI